MGDTKKIIGSLPVGTIINASGERYLVEDVLGAGGFGITYRVTRLSDRKCYAMKEYYPDKLCERCDDNTITFLKTNADDIETGMKDFITEAQRLGKQNISHPNIVSVDDVFKANNTAYYVMEYIDGDNLRQYVRKNKNRPLSVEQALSVMRPVLQAIALIHRHRLTHLDIKHDNILLTEENGSLRPVIIDFGLAKHYDKKGNATSKLTNAGCSEGFAPPEQYLGLYKFTPQADVYALAATLLYLLTAKVPVKSSEISSSAILASMPDDVPQRVRDALVNAMHKDMSERTQSVAQLAEELGLDISSQDYEGNVTRLLNLDKHKSGHGRAVKITAGVAIAAAVAGGVYWFAAGSHPSESELLTTAIRERNLEEVRRFADMDSVRAYIPCSELLIRQDDFAEGIIYAEKALSTADSVRARDLIETARGYLAEMRQEPVAAAEESEPETADEIKVPETLPDKTPEQPAAADTPAVPTDDQLFAKAETIADFKALADKGYTKAYAPLAEKYFMSKNYSGADAYARKALAANANRQQAISVVEKLDVIGYYDNGENGGKPQY